MKRLILPTLMIGIILALASVTQAQTPLQGDTMRVVDSYGRPGDTISVFVYFENSIFNIGGYVGRVVFDRNVLQFINYTCIDRGCVFDATGGIAEGDTAVAFNGYTFTPNVWIVRGAGNVGRLRFLIKPTAPTGSSAVVFRDRGTQVVNSWSDTTGFELFVPSLVNGNVIVTSGTINTPPTIGYVAPQSVAEGSVLSFEVNAYDLDGDPVTLTAEDTPPNSSFPTISPDSSVTGIFTFSPSYEQGPDTIFVTFRASDNFNNVTTLSVRIIILDQPNDQLVVNSSQGGVPGATNRALDVDLYNSIGVYGLQFKYLYDQNQIQVFDVIPTERCLGLGFWYNVPAPGEIIVLIFSPGLDPIDPGTGAIVQFITNVNSAAQFGRTAVVLDSAIEVIDSIGTSRNLLCQNGYFTVDRFGDANLDEAVNVGDCVTIVAFIIERIELNVRQFDAGDINRDGRVNVADLQTVIDRILMLPLGPAPNPPMRPIVVEFGPQVTQVGDLVTIDMISDISVEAAAVQYKINFNSQNLEPLSVEPGEMVSSLQYDENISGGKISGVFYDLTGGTFGPSQGSLASFTFRVRNGEFDPRDLNISEFVIVDRGAALIESEIKGQLPVQYNLSQNYPNPFNANTNISFDLPHDAQVELSIYDVMGRQVALLASDYLQVGHHVFTWDGRSNTGQEMATGVFFYRLRSSEFDETKKMLLVK